MNPIEDIKRAKKLIEDSTGTAYYQTFLGFRVSTEVQKHKNYVKHIKDDWHCNCWLKCMNCGEEYPCRDFHPNPDKISGKENSCKYCWAKYGKHK
jgi:hypothetical protein